MEEKANLTT